MNPGDEIGIVVGGSLTKAIEVRLNPGAIAPLGHYVMLPVGDESFLLGMVTDVMLKSAESGPTAWPPPSDDEPAHGVLREVLLDTGVYTAVEVTPYLEVDPHDATQSSKARRLPQHFVRAFPADQEAMNAALPAGDDAVQIGNPLGMSDLMVYSDVDRLFERSAGVFGKSGTGKTMFALGLLDALLSASESRRGKESETVALIFDMHDDYGKQTKFEGGEIAAIPSLCTLHPASVSVFTLEQDRATGSFDGRIVIGTRDIGVEDLQLLQTSASFTGPAIEAAYQFEARVGRGWIDELLADDPSDALVAKLWPSDAPDEITWPRVADRVGVHQGSLGNLRRGLRSITRHAFVQSGQGQFNDSLRQIVALLREGRSVVIQFGKYGNDLASYMLVANMLSRRVWAEYRDAKEEAIAARGAKSPNRLVIVIEEAHKFMDASVSSFSIFGQIARELRKYNVTLLVIDQRPSQIDREVLSQIGTKCSFQLDNDQDVDALLGGISGRSGLKQVLATLESQQQALVFGHALAMPVVVRPPDRLNATTGDRPTGGLRARLGAPVRSIDEARSRREATSGGGLYGA